jgi:hypothetical protein
MNSYALSNFSCREMRVGFEMFKPLGGKRIKGESICLSKNLIYLKEIQ